MLFQWQVFSPALRLRVCALSAFALVRLSFFFCCAFRFFFVLRICFCRVVFVPSLSSCFARLFPPPTASAACVSCPTRASRFLWCVSRVFIFCFALLPACTEKNSPCLMGLCSARRHSPSPVRPLALSPLRPVSHLLSAPFQCGLCCLRVVCAKNACVDRAPFLSRRLPFLFFLSSILSRALRHRISILAGQCVCVRARSSAAQVRRRSDQERAILSRQDHSANRRACRALQVKSRDFFHPTQFQVRRLRSSPAQVRHRSDQERTRLSRQEHAANPSSARTPRA